MKACFREPSSLTFQVPLPRQRYTSPASMASFLPVLQMSGSVPCFAADPGAQALRAGRSSKRERLKIEQQFGRIPGQLLHLNLLCTLSLMGSIRHEFSLAPSPTSPAAAYHQRLPGEGSRGRSGKGQEVCALVVLSVGRSGGCSDSFHMSVSRKEQAGPARGHLCPGTLWSNSVLVLAEAQISLPKHPGKCDLDPCSYAP